MKQFLSVFLLLGLVVAAAASEKRPAMVGGYQKIKNLNDPYVVQIAKFAVNEHNKEANSDLKFVKVVSGEEQVVSGMNYRLIIDAKDGYGDANYRAVVYDVAWRKYRSLTSFEKV